MAETNQFSHIDNILKRPKQYPPVSDFENVKPADEAFVSQSHWDQAYATSALAAVAVDDPLRRLLESRLPHGALSSFEFGCYPGRYLSVLGAMGHELHGVDLTPRVENDLPDWLRFQGYRVGTFTRDDVFNYKPDQTFDVVSSFGLIEHFTNWEELFLRHIHLLSPGGYLVVTTPNFRSAIQHALHRMVDDVNLRRHNLAAMDPRRWVELATNEGLEVLYSGGIGRFDFWVDIQERHIFQKLLLKTVRLTKPLWNLCPQDTLQFSPFYGIVAKCPK